MPAGWKGKPLEGTLGNVRQIVFTPEGRAEAPEERPQASLSYVRYEYASRRVGKTKGWVEPKEVLDGYLRQTYEKIQDPQKVWQQITPIAQRRKDRYTVGAFAYTSGSDRQADKILVYYQPDQDILDVLIFTAAPDLGEWDPFVEACFSTARLGLGKAGTSSPREAI